jgi:hypothetical protein
MDQGFRHDFSWVIVVIRLGSFSQGWSFIRRYNWGSIHVQAIRSGTWIYFLDGACIEIFSFKMAVGWRLIAVSCQIDLLNISACLIKVWKPRTWIPAKRKSASKMEVTILSNLIMEVTSHHLYYFLLVRSKLLDQPALKTKRLHESKYQETGTIGGQFRISLSYCVIELW